MSRASFALSVRARLTLVMAAISAVAFSMIALAAPNAVRPVLEDDLLDTEAESSSLLISNLGGSTRLDPDDLIRIPGADLFPLDPDVLLDVGELLDDFLSGSAPTDEQLDEIAAEQVELLRSIDRLDLLSDAAGGTFVIESGPTTGTLVEPDGSFRVVDDLAAEVEGDVPIMPSSEFDELLFDDVGLREVGSGAFVETEPNARTIAGVVEVDDTRLLVAADAAAVDRSIDRVRFGLWLAVPVLTGVVAAIAWFLTSRALRPVAAITQRAATISGGSLSARVPVPKTSDEISTLATTVNEMLDRLESDDRARRRFISDASHELRSPVAVMRNDAEVALRHPDSSDVGELAAVVADESSRLSTIIDDLLALARNDEGVIVNATDVDLDDIVLAEAARSRGVPVDTSRVSAGRVRGRPDELTRLVGHLVDNASRHAHQRVAVELRTTSEGVQLAVDDDGPGVPPADQERIFERFVRLDDARTRDRGGAGLGLAVVRGIAERSGGSVRVAPSLLGGARFVVTFPATS